MDKVALVEKEILAGMQKDYPAFEAGDIIKLWYKIKEKDKERLHPIEGVVLKIQGAMHRKSFTLRRIAYGEAYEVSFPYFTPNIAKLEITKKVVKRTRRARLYYLRKRIGRSAMTA